MGKRVTAPKIPAEERKKSFAEVEKTILPHQAMAEASRCLFCHDAPCDQMCPAGIKPSQFIRKIKTRNFTGAAKMIRDGNFLGSVCARICPVEKQCEKGCSRSDVGEPINIAALQRYAADMELKKIKPILTPPAPKGKKAAIIGAGPAGIACAWELYKLGWEVFVYEKTSQPGGLLIWGIPEYRLPRDVVKSEIDAVLSSGGGIHLYTNQSVDREKFQTMLSSHDAVVIACGLGDSTRANIPGEDLKGVYPALDFLMKMNSGTPYPVGKKVIVIGGGSTALDCASSSVRLGAEDVAIYYRRTESEMPGARSELEEAKEIGVRFVWLASPKKIVGNNGKAEGVEFVKCELGEPDSSGRPRPVEIACSEYVAPADTVIMALGQKLDKDLSSYLGDFVQMEKGRIKFDRDTLVTSDPRVYLAGDISSGGGTVAQAVGDGKKAALNIDKNLG